ncbi:uncharacterized protein [Amphiura filiformis]|uniref:uncharacterized protein isoform X2 n=1 Tax=Amphiura filiformis TaxID=82378 RepID=UPI003B21C2DE
MAAPMSKMLPRISVRFWNHCFSQQMGIQPNHVRVLLNNVYGKFKQSHPVLLQQSVTRPICMSTKCWADEGHKQDGGFQGFKKEHEITDQDVEDAIEYIESSEYIKSYGGNPVWSNYRRNFKGQVPRWKTRKSCIRGQRLESNPCPICRDRQLLLHYKNVELLKQFINEDNWHIFPPQQTGLCQKTQKRLVKAVETAQNYGLLPFTMPYVEYDYDEYYAKADKEESSSSS